MRLWNRLLFNFWYFFKPPWDSGISPPELLEFIEKNQPGRAIDLGCGTGTNVITLAMHGWQVTGVDFARRAIAIAKRKTQAADILADLRVGDVTRLQDVSGLFDLALDMGCFHGLAIEEQSAYLNRLKELLAKGGTWLMYGFFKTDHSGPSPGLTDATVDMMMAHFQLVKRVDGSDKRGRHSAWFQYLNNSEPDTL